MTQSLILSINVCRGLERSPLPPINKHPPEFFSSRCWPNIGPMILFSGFFKIRFFPVESSDSYHCWASSYSNAAPTPGCDRLLSLMNSAIMLLMVYIIDACLCSNPSLSSRRSF